jgi:hypothetical protein
MRPFRLLPLLLPVLAACGDAPPAPPADPPAGALALLASLDQGTFADAYERLDRYAHTAEVRLTVSGDEGTWTATRTVARRPTEDGVEERLVSADSTGPFGGPWAARLRPQNPLPALLPDEPVFLTPRGREAYRYTLGADTLVGGRQMQVVEAALRPGAGGEQAVRRARYFLAPATEAVLGLALERASTSALFDEEERAALFLQPGPDGAPVPAVAVVETTVDVPGAAPRQLRVEQRFRDVRAVPN